MEWKNKNLTLIPSQFSDSSTASKYWPNGMIFHQPRFPWNSRGPISLRNGYLSRGPTTRSLGDLRLPWLSTTTTSPWEPILQVVPSSQPLRRKRSIWGSQQHPTEEYLGFFVSAVSLWGFGKFPVLKIDFPSHFQTVDGRNPAPPGMYRTL